MASVNLIGNITVNLQTESSFYAFKETSSLTEIFEKILKGKFLEASTPECSSFKERSFFTANLVSLSSAFFSVFQGKPVAVDEKIETDLKEISQTSLIPVLMKLGYKTNPVGLCFGLTFMGIQAILSGDIRSFDLRLKKIAKLISTGILSKEDKVDLSAFFDGVELYSQACRYPHLFEKGVRPSIQNDPNLLKALFSLVSSDVLKEKGGLLKMAQFSGLYTKNELKRYFESLNKTCTEVGAPFALQLSSANHSIAVGYDLVEKKWICIDTRNISSTKYTDLDLLAKTVLMSFLGEDIDQSVIEDCSVALSSTLYVSKKDAPLFQPEISRWQSSSEFQETQKITAAKSQTDSSNSSWLIIAAQTGDLQSVNKLIDAGAEMESPGPGDFTPLLFAAQNGHFEVVRALLKEGADCNKMSTVCHCGALALASQNGHLEIVGDLLEAGVDVDQKDFEGPTALMQASLCGRLDVVTLLLEKKADVNQADTDGSTALILAAQEGHLEIVNALLDKGADRKAMISGYTAYQLAFGHGHLEVAAVLQLNS